MEWVVTTGRTVEEAIDAALDQLGVDEADAEFDILEEPRQGLFGRQRGEARVRARVRPTAPRPKLDRRDRRRRSRDDRDGKTRDTSTVATVASSPGRPASGRVAGGQPPGQPAASGESAEPAEAGDNDGEPAGNGRSRRRRSRRRPGDRPEGDAARRGGNDDDEEMSEPVMEEHSLAEQGEEAKKFLAGLLEQFGLTATVSVVEVEEDTVEVRVEGNDLGLLIGPRGQTLAAVQDLARTVVQRHSPSRNGRLVVDVAGYRQRRREALERFTRQVAQDVVSSGIQRALEPMTAADRKVVHDTANQIPGVHTISEGEDPRRRVVILPGPASA
jgi:spoIIIJ-associated protein